MDVELRALLDAVQVQLAAGEERLEASRAVLTEAALFDIEQAVQEDLMIGYAPVIAADYVPDFAEPLAEAFFIPEGKNELDAMFDDIDSLFDEE